MQAVAVSSRLVRRFNRTQLQDPMKVANATEQSLPTEDEQTRIAYMSENDLSELHMGLGQWVRNHLGLWDVNSELLAVTGEPDADDASAVIVRAFWSTLRSQLPKVH